MLDMSRLEAFAAAFAALGALHLTAPDDQSLSAVRSLVEEWPLDSQGPCGEGISLWRESARSEEKADVVARDHDRLYGDSATGLVAPFESVHRGTEGLVFDEQTLQVRAAYRAFNLQAPRLNREPDDHIGLEFEFLSRVCLRTMDALTVPDDPGAENALDMGRSFLSEHVLMWAPSVLTRVAEAADTSFMSGLALLSLGTIEQFATAVGLSPTEA